MNGNWLVVEHSTSQGAFHIETVQEMLLTNVAAAVRGDKVDFVPVFFAATQEEADRFLRSFRKKVPPPA